MPTFTAPSTWAQHLPEMQESLSDIIGEPIHLAVVAGPEVHKRVQRLARLVNGGLLYDESLMLRTRPPFLSVPALSVLDETVHLDVLRPVVSGFAADGAVVRILLEWVHDPEESYFDRHDAAYTAAGRLIRFVREINPDLPVRVLVVGLADIQDDGLANVYPYGTVTHTDVEGS